MKTSQTLVGLALLSLLVLPSDVFAAEAAARQLVYYGTYTGGKSRGIYVSRFDPATGRLSAPELAAETASPSFLAVHPTKPLLFAVNEVGDFSGKKSGAVGAFAIDRQSGKLTLLNQQPSGGDGPCHLIVDKRGRHVIAANYGSGSTVVLPIGDDGRLGASSAFVQHEGASINKSRQEGPHAHCAALDNANRFAFIADLGLDKILVFKYDPANGSLIPNTPPSASVKPGSGPRHFAFTPGNRFGYVINEINCTLTAFSHDAGRGVLSEIQTVSTLPPGEVFLPSYSTAELEVHPSGKFIYGSNRGHDTIAVFAIDSKSGKLSLVQHQPTGGKVPRSFGIDPSGRWLLAANQDSDSVTVFGIDQKTGRLTSTGESVTVGKPVCVKFVSAK
jgi:6-phosphogluconolactonase